MSVMALSEWRYGTGVFMCMFAVCPSTSGPTKNRKQNAGMLGTTVVLSVFKRDAYCFARGISICFFYICI